MKQIAAGKVSQCSSHPTDAPRLTSASGALGFPEDRPRARDRPPHLEIGLGRSTLCTCPLWSPTVVEAA